MKDREPPNEFVRINDTWRVYKTEHTYHVAYIRQRTHFGNTVWAPLRDENQWQWRDAPEGAMVIVLGSPGFNHHNTKRFGDISAVFHGTGLFFVDKANLLFDNERRCSDVRFCNEDE